MRIILVALSCFLIMGAQADCPDGFNRIGNKCYWLSKDRVNWFKADMLCRERGARLITFDNAAELQALSDYLISTNCNKLQVGCVFWTSSNCLSVKRQFFWQTNGKPTDLSFFGPLEPNNAGGKESCVDLRFNSENRFGLNDVECEMDFANYICEPQIIPSRDIKWCACTLNNNTVVMGSPEEVC